MGFAEVPFVQEETEVVTGDVNDDNNVAGDEKTEAAADNSVDKLEAGKDVAWPAGALEEHDEEVHVAGGNMTKEEVDAQQEANEAAFESHGMDEKVKNMVATSKIFSKV